MLSLTTASCKTLGVSGLSPPDGAASCSPTSFPYWLAGRGNLKEHSFVSHVRSEGLPSKFGEIQRFPWLSSLQLPPLAPMFSSTHTLEAYLFGVLFIYLFLTPNMVPGGTKPLRLTECTPGLEKQLESCLTDGLSASASLLQGTTQWYLFEEGAVRRSVRVMNQCL